MLELFLRGGHVMWVIVVFSLVGVFLFGERLLHLHRARIGSTDFFKGLHNVLRKPNLVEAITICEDTAGPVAHVVRAALLHYDESDEKVRKAVEEAGLMEIPRLERNVSLLAALAQVVPLTGLFGTVLGLMQSLSAIERQAPLVHAGDVSAGLWQALISTAAALLVAILAHAGHHFLASRVDSIILDMERAASEILGFIRKQRMSTQPPEP
jgi:biopolymer transport protein ExbB